MCSVAEGSGENMDKQQRLITDHMVTGDRKTADTESEETIDNKSKG